MRTRAIQGFFVGSSLFLAGFVPVACSGPAGPPGASATLPDGGGAGGSGAGGAKQESDAGVFDKDLKLVVSTSQEARPISPLVYGINGAKSADATKAKLVRLGGNDLSAYGWETNNSNGGNLKGFENFAMSPGAAPGDAVSEVVKAAAANGGAAHVTVPIGDYVAADRNPGDVHSSGAGYLATRFKKNKATKGGPLAATPDLNDDSVYEDEFTNWVKAQAGSTPVLFSLDNQPELWSDDHAESHPTKSTYADVIARNIQYAKMIKQVWPGAPVTGYASYGWQGYMNLQNATDAQSKMFVTTYLDAMKQAEADSGGRLLDYLDIHWYPEAQGGGVRIIAPDAGPEIQKARLQAPRSLWDSSYHETSWINDQLQASAESINLIPRAKGWISDHYPGTKLAISAWYYGGGADISGAIATADVLGIFGREGVDAAAVDFPPGVDDSYTIAGFLTYLNYDGKGGQFGDTSVKATSTDKEGFSIYASTRSSDPSKVVIIALNKRTEAQNATLTIEGPSSYGACAVYELDSTAPTFGQQPMLMASMPSTFSFKVPGRSISVIVPQ